MFSNKNPTKKHINKLLAVISLITSLVIKAKDNPNKHNLNIKNKMTSSVVDNQFNKLQILNKILKANMVLLTIILEAAANLNKTLICLILLNTLLNKLANTKKENLNSKKMNKKELKS